MFSFLGSIATFWSTESTNWTPTTPLPRGYVEERLQFVIPVHEGSSISLDPQGASSHGTVVFDKESSRVGKPTDGPPAYDVAVGIDSKGKSSRGELRIEVVCRHDNAQLWQEVRMEQSHGPGDVVGLKISTPGNSLAYLSSHLSFHVTFLFPASPLKIQRLSVHGAGWRTLGTPSLAQIHFDDVSILTGGAPVDFRSLVAGQVVIENSNASVSGEYRVESIRIKTVNGRIDAVVEARKACVCETKNEKIVGNYFGRTLDISTGNANIEGDYVALDSLKLSTANAEISGTFTGKSISARTSNGPLCGSFSVASSLDLTTSNSPILVDVRLVADESTPPLLDQKKSKLIGNIVKSRVVSSNAKINISFDQPAGVQLDSEVKTSNAAIISRHGSNFGGKFVVSTSNAKATVSASPSSNIDFISQSKSFVEGTISGGSSGVGSCSILRTSNAAASMSCV